MGTIESMEGKYIFDIVKHFFFVLCGALEMEMTDLLQVDAIQSHFFHHYVSQLK